MYIHRIYCSHCEYSHHEDYGNLSICDNCHDRVCSSCYGKYKGKILCTKKCYDKVKRKDKLHTLLNELEKVVAQYEDYKVMDLIDEIKILV